MSIEYIPALRFKALTRFYDPVVRWTTRESTVKPALIQQANVPEDGTVIDLGCGTGTLTVGLKQRYPTARVIGLDADAMSLDYAQAKADAAGVDIEFYKGDAADLPFDAALADRVVSSLFFHHLRPDDKQRVLTQVARVLKEGGELHVSDWGLPTNGLMRALFVPVQLLDGFSNTRENVQGQLPVMVGETGLQAVNERASFDTVFGTLRLFVATKW